MLLRWIRWGLGYVEFSIHGKEPERFLNRAARIIFIYGGSARKPGTKRKSCWRVCERKPILCCVRRPNGRRPACGWKSGSACRFSVPPLERETRPVVRRRGRGGNFAFAFHAGVVHPCAGAGNRRSGAGQAGGVFPGAQTGDAAQRGGFAAPANPTDAGNPGAFLGFGEHLGEPGHD